MLVAGSFLAVLFVAFVFGPAVARGGLGEFAIVGVVFAAILVAERVIRSR